MFKYISITFIVIFIVVNTSNILAQPIVKESASNFLIREDFNDLKNWKTLKFPKIEKTTTYEIDSQSAKLSLLKIVSKQSSSALVFSEPINARKTPHISWRWKISNIYKNIDELKKSGDDYPIRIYVMFKYDPSNASFLERSKFEALKLIYGEYPPKSTINYVWASETDLPENYDSPYTDTVKIIPLQSGSKNIGEFVENNVNILNDYKRIFNEEPPLEATLAIMADSDNSSQEVESFVDWIEISKEP